MKIVIKEGTEKEIKQRPFLGLTMKEIENEVKTSIRAQIMNSLKSERELALDGLLEFIKGEGRFRLFGTGIHTYPGEESHKGCLELEKRGLIYREIDEKDHVFWVPYKEHYHAKLGPVIGEEVVK